MDALPPRPWFLVACLALSCSAGSDGTVLGDGDASTGPRADARADVVSARDASIDRAPIDVPTTRDATMDLATTTDASPADAASSADVTSVYDTGVAPATDACAMAACTSRPQGCGPREVCGNGLDDDCNGTVDDVCPCIPGTVEDCNLAPPGRTGVGACRGGSQRCEGNGEFGRWGACTGGISPGAEACNGLDDDCDGCVDNGICCTAPMISCPAPGDPRIPDGRPFEDYPLRGGLFYTGTARSWGWRVEGGPCDTLLPRPTFQLLGVGGRDVLFRPTLSGDYRVTLDVVTSTGEHFTCSWIVHVAGPGLRVELCWDTSTTVDLDLYVHDPRNTNPWFDSAASPLTSTNNNSCNWSNCEATLRGTRGRVDWGYRTSPLVNCQNGPHGAEWRAAGACSNPRLDIDNNLAKASGVPENANVDAPRGGERFRVMVQNFTGSAARPIINVYCAGHLRATLGAPLGSVGDFTGRSGSASVGAMWRAADVAPRVDASGATTDCTVTPLHAPGATSGYWLTRDNPAY